MKRLKFSRLSLRTRIYASFGIIGAIAILVMAIAFGGIARMVDDFNRFAVYSENGQLGLLLSRDIMALQRSADLFMHEGHASAAQQVEYIYGRARRHLADLRVEENTELASRRQAIDHHLQVYHRVFADVISHRDIQSGLVEDIHRHAADSETLIAGYLAALGESGRSDLAHRLQAIPLRVENNAYRYFESLDPVFVRRARSDFTEAQALMGELSRLEREGQSEQLLQPLRGSLADYRSVVLESAQRTRGYLYLVNVVMAAEAYEVLYQTRQLTDLIQVEMSGIERQMDTYIGRAKMLALAAALALLLVVVMLSYRVGHGIAAPIVSLTATFRRLADGNDDTPITRQGTENELGELSRAAEVFRQRNLETRRVLDNFRTLSGELEAKVAERTRALETANARLEALSQTDGLTGLFNRRYFDQQLDREWARAARSGLPLSVIMLDVDFFKPYNDSYGHQAGDEGLRSLAAILRDNLRRESDLAARYGGEEFVILLQDTSGGEAMTMAERIRRSMAELNLPNPASPHGRVTISLGVAVHVEEDGMEDGHALVKLADDALYRSKAEGKNRVSALVVRGGVVPHAEQAPQS